MYSPRRSLSLTQLRVLKTSHSTYPDSYQETVNIHETLTTNYMPQHQARWKLFSIGPAKSKFVYENKPRHKTGPPALHMG